MKKEKYILCGKEVLPFCSCRKLSGSGDVSLQNFKEEVGLDAEARALLVLLWAGGVNSYHELYNFAQHLRLVYHITNPVSGKAM